MSLRESPDSPTPHDQVWVTAKYTRGSRVSWKYGTGVIASNPYWFPAGGRHCWRVEVLVDQTGELVTFGIDEFRIVESKKVDEDDW